MRRRVVLVSGARPNYMKVAPLMREMRERPDWAPVLVNTGQHFDAEMSSVFIEQLGMPKPDVDLGAGGGTPAQQWARILEGVARVCEELRPQLCIVVGDVTSTVAGAIGAMCTGVRIAHVEAGLRSGDWGMPEERNRIMTDRISDLLFTPSADADENLLREGIAAAKVHMVGNVMIDSLEWVLGRMSEHERSCVCDEPYVLVTMHRPANVDEPAVLRELVEAVCEVAQTRRVVWPLHPRARRRLEEFGISIPGEITMTPPLGYLEFVKAMMQAEVVLTDSGGIQEETVVLGVPCLVMRPTTERPITLRYGKNRLVPSSAAAIVSAVHDAWGARVEREDAVRPPLWDGRAASRIMDVLEDDLEGQCAW